jgi:hypothetical protein
MGNASLILKVAVNINPPLKKSLGAYTVSCHIIKQASAFKSERSCSLIWEAGGPTVHIHDIEQDDLVMLRVTANGKTWETNHFSPLGPEVSLEEIVS